MTTSYDTEVLVIGAGPVGLTVATDLAQRGVRVTLVDYFKGAVHSARFTKRALKPAEFTRIR